VLSIVALGSLLFAIIEGPDKGWTGPVTLAAFAIGLVALIAFVTWELYTPNPMLDMTFFKNPRFSAANGAVTLSMFALFGSLFLMTQYWQLVHGYSPLQAGVRLIPYAMTMMITAPLSARLVERLGTKRVVTMGLSIISVAMVVLSTIHTDSSYARVIVNMCFMAFGMALTMAPATESVMGSLPRSKAGVGSAVNDTTRQMGGALGVAIIGSLVASVYASGIDDVAGAFGLGGSVADEARGSLGAALKVSGDLGPAGADFARAAKDSFVHGLSQGLLLGAAVVAVAAFVAYRFLPAAAQDELVIVEDSPARLTPVAGS
jgi:Na+/melibiose symporter-like transporter